MNAGVPAGFAYRPDIVTEAEERALAEAAAHLVLGEIRMRGQVARRRTAHFGWRYGYETWRIEPGPPMPPWLLATRERAAALLDLAPEALAEALVTEYPPGAGIGWHRDAPMFGEVVAVSLLAGCRLQFQRGTGEGRLAFELPVAPRSAYVLAGAARWQWQHRIPPVRALRYSITFRTVRAGYRGGRRRAEAPGGEGHDE